ncbi:MAG TPA: type II toxin-antitoxin system Phd/YefM family antitoxin [Verrucomicrobiae bacterium]|jgi:hypothetical protein|nr:type II toxin-antitoxin system Phd/YefM family antitoxin [Verrucomicrobiae bacterium]
MINVRDIRSLTDFQRNTRAHLRRLKLTRRPEILTINGKAELIVQDAEAFEEMFAVARGIQQGSDELKAGEGESGRKVLKRLRAKHKIPLLPRRDRS